jgi:hypothetical protein
MVDFVKREFLGAHSWVATFASLSALGFSGYNFSQLQEDPHSVLTLPVSLKMEAEEAGGMSLFIQPSVYTRFDTQDVEMINDVRLSLRPEAAAAAKPDFYWRDTVKWSVRHDTKADDNVSTWWEFASDPAPFTVTQDNPAQLSFRFLTHNWKMTPGRHTGTLALLRASTRKPIEQPFCVILRPEDIAKLKKDTEWYEFRSDLPGKNGDGCYHWDR